MTIGQKIKNLREKKKITQTELAELIGTTKQNIYKYENGIITNIPSDKVEMIAKILSVSPAYLMGWSDVPMNKKHDNNENADLSYNHDIRRIERARKLMPPEKWDSMMKTVEAAFSEYFDDDYVDDDLDE